MLTRQIENVQAALGELVGKIETEEWETISHCLRILADVRESVDHLERLPLALYTTTEAKA